MNEPVALSASVTDSIFNDPEYQARSWQWHTGLIGLGHHRSSAAVRMAEHPRVQSLISDGLRARDINKLKNQAMVLGVYSIRNDGYIRPEWDLSEFSAVYDAEPLVRKATARQMNLWFKGAFDIIGDNTPYVDYIRRRFRQIAYATGTPTIDLFKSIVRSLLKYSNAFVIKVRNDKLSGGIRGELNKKPIAGYFPVSPLTIFPRFERGKLAKWCRYIHNSTQLIEHDPEDVIHFAWDREEDFLFGKPRLLGVTEDVAALRRIEENVEILLAKFLFPMYHMVVGTPESPARYYNDGTSELDIGRLCFQAMEQEGALITSERYEIRTIGLDKTLDAEPYLQHFKSRVYTGLGVSAVDMGEGDTANRATADNISQNLKDLVLEDQKFFAAQVQLYMFAELFQEHPDKISALNAFDQVRLRFTNVDLDNQIKSENHQINLFNNNGITQTELRKEIGRLPLSASEQSEMHFELFELALALLMAPDETYAADPTSGALKPAGPTQEKTALLEGMRRRANPPANASQPENQHGKALGPTKRKSSFDQRLLGRGALPTLLEALIDCPSFEDASRTVSNRFPHIVDQERILPVLREAYATPDFDARRRASLVMALASIAGPYLDPGDTPIGDS